MNDIPVRVIGAPGHESVAHLQPEFWSLGKRLSRGSVRLGAFWAAAGVSVLVPVLHFILVPLLFLGGIFALVWQLRFQGRFGDGKVNCPECGESLQLKDVRFQLPLYHPCPACAQQVYLEPAPQIAGRG